MGGYTILLLALVNGFLVEKFSGSDRLKRLARLLYAAVAVQIALGIANIMLLVPAVIGVLHLGGAAFLFHVGIRQFRLVTKK
jgi:heme A synthase